MRTLLIVPALAILRGAALFWTWAGRPVRMPTDIAERNALIDGLRAVKLGDPVPPAWLERAKKLHVPNADLGAARRELVSFGENVSNPNDDAAVWGRAIGAPVRAAREAEGRMEFYREWRIPISIAAFAVTLLLFALAFTKPKPASLSTANPEYPQ